jgi:hypothetical protein
MDPQIDPKDILRHQGSDTPAYHVWVHNWPTKTNPGKAHYMAAVRTAAKEAIASSISADDVEVEVLYSTLRRRHMRGDIDRVLKPTLDALKGIAYIDDIQVRSVTATLFERMHASMLSGRVEYIGRLRYPG